MARHGVRGGSANAFRHNSTHHRKLRGRRAPRRSRALARPARGPRRPRRVGSSRRGGRPRTQDRCDPWGDRRPSPLQLRPARRAPRGTRARGARHRAGDDDWGGSRRRKSHLRRAQRRGARILRRRGRDARLSARAGADASRYRHGWRRLGAFAACCRSAARTSRGSSRASTNSSWRPLPSIVHHCSPPRARGSRRSPGCRFSCSMCPSTPRWSLLSPSV